MYIASTYIITCNFDESLEIINRSFLNFIQVASVGGVGWQRNIGHYVIIFEIIPLAQENVITISFQKNSTFIYFVSYI